MNKKEQKEFIDEYFSQDNCATAYPIYFQIRDIDYVASYHWDEANRYVLVLDDGVHVAGNTISELFKEIAKDDDLPIPAGIDINNAYLDDGDCTYFVEMLREHTVDCCGIFAEKKSHTYKGMFLLSSEAREHLKKNHYHYSKEAIVYCQHAWRAPRQENFLKSIGGLQKTGGDKNE